MDVNKQKEKALIKCGLGIFNKNEEQATKGIDEFIRLSILELEADNMPDEED